MFGSILGSAVDTISSVNKVASDLVVDVATSAVDVVSLGQLSDKQRMQVAGAVALGMSAYEISQATGVAESLIEELL